MRRLRIFVVFFLSLAAGVSSWGQPSVQTLAPDSVSQSSAVFRALVTPGPLPWEVLFWWGPIDYCYYSTYAGTVSGAGPVEVRARPGRLLPGVAYQCRAVLYRYGPPGVYIFGNVLTFNTPTDTNAGGFVIPLRMTDGGGSGNSLQLSFGVHTHARYCLDWELGERLLPPEPPVGAGDRRFIDYRGYFSQCMDMGLDKDLRGYVHSAQVDTYKVRFQVGQDGYPMVVNWPDLNHHYAGSVRLIDSYFQGWLNIDMKAQHSVSLGEPWREFLIVAESPVHPARLTSARGTEIGPTGFFLNQNYPNPFNPSTTFRLALPKEAGVSLRVYNTLGQEVAELLNTKLAAGYHDVVWDGKNLDGVGVGSGVYFVRIEAIASDGDSRYIDVKKVLLMK